MQIPYRTNASILGTSEPPKSTYLLHILKTARILCKVLTFKSLTETYLYRNTSTFQEKVSVQTV